MKAFCRCGFGGQEGGLSSWLRGGCFWRGGVNAPQLGLGELRKKGSGCLLLNVADVSWRTGVPPLLPLPAAQESVRLDLIDRSIDHTRVWYPGKKRRGNHAYVWVDDG